MGQNPTGSRLPSHRYEAIYAIARAWGFTIVEDDPYFYMQHGADAPDAAVPGLTGLGPSYLSIDTDGRVIRLDSFSKVSSDEFGGDGRAVRVGHR